MCGRCEFHSNLKILRKFFCCCYCWDFVCLIFIFVVDVVWSVSNFELLSSFVSIGPKLFLHYYYCVKCAPQPNPVRFFPLIGWSVFHRWFWFELRTQYKKWQIWLFGVHACTNWLLIFFDSIDQPFFYWSIHCIWLSGQNKK